MIIYSKFLHSSTITFILFFFFLSTQTVFGQSPKYYICGGKYAECYHTNSNCRGLNNCRSDIYYTYNTSGYRPCSICGGYSSPSSNYPPKNYSNTERAIPKKNPLHDFKVKLYHNSEKKVLTVPPGKYWWVSKSCGLEGLTTQYARNLESGLDSLKEVKGTYVFNNNFNSHFLGTWAYNKRSSLWCYESGESIILYENRTNHDDEIVGCCMAEIYEFEGIPDPLMLNVGRIGFYTKMDIIGSIEIYIDGIKIGTLTEKYDGKYDNPLCGDNGTKSVILPVGVYSYKAKTSSGEAWSGVVSVKVRECVIEEIK